MWTCWVHIIQLFFINKDIFHVKNNEQGPVIRMHLGG